MKSFLFALLLLPGLHSIVAQQSPPSPEQSITRMLNIKVPGKVCSVIWQIQEAGCSVALELPTFLSAGPMPKAPITQVWLLRADGTGIPQRSGPAMMIDTNGAAVTPSILYAFPSSASSDAVALVISADGQFVVEALTAKPK